VLILACYVGFWINLVRLLEEAEKNFFSTFTIILYQNFFILSNARFQWRPGPYGLWTGLRARQARPGRIFSLFGKKLIRLAGPQGPIFVSNGPGFREVGPPRPRAARFQRKMGAYGGFSALRAFKPPKNYKKMTKMLQKFNIF